MCIDKLLSWCYTKLNKTKEGEIIISEFDRIEYWIEIAEYDLETAKAMLKSKRYLYVGFMCNQVIEKILKAYFVKVNKAQPPYTHKLIRLAEECNLYKTMSDQQKNFIFEITPLNIEARYPTLKDEIAKVLNKQNCKKIIKETEEMVQWIKSKL